MKVLSLLQIRNKEKHKKMKAQNLNPATLTKGQNIYYLGYPATVTNIDQDYNGAYIISVKYDAGNGRTKVRTHFNTEDFTK